uniref:Uncharacterized protein n=1 Tax=Arundo donax TaxID=35708 RepID=A0A0A9BR22_ARUDO
MQLTMNKKHGSLQTGILLQYLLWHDIFLSAMYNTVHISSFCLLLKAAFVIAASSRTILAKQFVIHLHKKLKQKSN